MHSYAETGERTFELGVSEAEHTAVRANEVIALEIRRGDHANDIADMNTETG
jgi:hypothetical protein